MGTLTKIFEGFHSKLGFYARISSSAPILNVKPELKRPASPFALFFQEKSQTLKIENPEMTQRDIMKLASTLWNSASYEQQRFKDLYESKLSAYKQTVKVPPKRPVNPYIKFYMDNNDSLSVIYPNVLDRSKKTSQMWKDLSEYEKSQYRMEYAKELSKFRENLTEEDKEAIQNRKDALNNRRERQNVRKYGREAWKEKPKISASNPYVEFIREQTPQVPKGENIFTYLSKSWRQLGESEKLKYKEMASQNTELDRKKLTEWEEKNNVD